MTWLAYDMGVLAALRGDHQAAREHLAAAGPDGRALLLLGQLGGPDDSYERAAELGNAEAAYNLGARRAMAEDWPAALRWYERSAELGEPGARRMLGIMYATGQGVPVDDAVAESYWRAAADGDERAFRDLGTLFAYHRDDPAEAAHWFLKAAQAGDPTAPKELKRLASRLNRDDRRARTLLGVIHGFQLNDRATAVTLLTVSADEGDPIAQRSLGFLVQGEDPDRAAALYRSAAEAGDTIAAFNVALLTGPTPEAVPWLRIAAEAGMAEAYPVLADRLSEQDRDEEARSWYLKGAEAGQVKSMFALAAWYRDGFGGPVDLVQALRWYLTMLEHGSGDGMHEVHGFVDRMTPDEIHEAGRLSGRYAEADLLAA
ncbi:tetratricopeptide repeat protein [Actinoplanes palleronii]|uniref:Sel1 repeat family protein n=1 Tax=Actinoplanes palleronii TaxID=113570 RepID=A0ABQ4BRT2_9ACTN|nr:SEL1-like repeat protein [Actinoplanes palleronii]GIE73394.1 hypothetical protein Apa02nite_095020 [Actinoplanes palleronii]